jgi:hypothetical protein
MIRFITGFSLILASLIIVYIASPIPYYLSPKQQRLYSLWQNDIARLSKDSNFSKLFANISTIDILFNDPEESEEFINFNTPFKSTNTNGYILKISITRWIESKHYGYVIEHEIFDKDDNKIYEFGRTYKIGLIF